MKLVDIDPNDPRLTSELLPVLQELRPHLTETSLREIYAEGHPQGLRLTAAYLDGRCVGVAGWRILALLVSGRKLYVDDLITSEEARGKGVGKALIAELADRARAAGCPVLDLDSGVHRKAAHRFYLRERMEIDSFHFTLRLA